MPRVTRDDVARRAGISPAVVSYVLNGGPRPVAAATRERVEQAMRELGYQPNLVARALRSARSNTIGLVVPDSTEPFFTELIHAIEQAAFRQGSLVLLGNSGFSRSTEQRYVASLAGMRVDGLLLVQAEVEGPRSVGASPPGVPIPVVYLNHRAPRGVDAPSVVLDNRGGARRATEHLLEHGHRRIGCLTGTARSGPVADRAKGWEEALKAAGLDRGPVLRTGLDRRSARVELKEWLQRPDRPEAVMATADGLAVDLLSVAQEVGLRVPQDLAVIGFGGTERAAHTWPGLSTAGHSFHDFAEEAVSTLRAAQAGETRRVRVLEADLVLRGSCGCPDVVAGADDDGEGTP